jgi:hypothetical protein
MLWILYGITILALIGLVSPSFDPVIKRITFSVVHRTRAVPQSWLYKHLGELLYLRRKKTTPGRFIYQTVLWFIAVLLLSYVATTKFPSMLPNSSTFAGSRIQVGNAVMGALFSFFIALCSIGIRYFYLRISGYYQQVQAGYDLYEVVKMLPRFADLSIDDALFSTSEQLGPKNLLYRPLQLLSFCLTNYTRAEELDGETKRFINTVGTTFAVAFISDMLYSHRTGTDWRESLVKLGSAMELRIMTILEAKKSFSEAIHMGLWGNWVSLIGIIGGLSYMVGFRVYAGLQFQSFIGSSLLVIVLITIFAGMICALYLRKPRLDYR